MALNRTFNITAALNLAGPVNARPVIAQIEKQLSNITANITVKLTGSTASQINALQGSFASFNTTIASTPKLINDVTAALTRLSSAISGASGLKTLQANLAGTATPIDNLKKGVSEATSELEEFGRVSGASIKRFLALELANNLIFTIIGTIGDGVKEAIAFEREMNKVAQTLGVTQGAVKPLSDEISRLSTSLGVSSKELGNISKILSQAGLSARDTRIILADLAETALTPSFNNLENTTEGVISSMGQFKIKADDVKDVLGSINAVSAQFAVESEDIIQAIRRTGGVFASMSKGVSEGKQALNEFIAIFASIRSSTRESSEGIATGLKTIFARLGRSETIENLKKLGVNLEDSEGKFIGAYKAVELLSTELSKLDQLDLKFFKITEELGGYRQINKVIPLIGEGAERIRAFNVAQAGTGSVSKQAAQAQETLAVKLAKVNEQFLALIKNVAQSETFKTIANFGIKTAEAFIAVADSLRDVIPLFAAVAAINILPGLVTYGKGFASGLGQTNPVSRIPTRTGKAYAHGDIVPGIGNSDSVPAMLTPGEFVIKKSSAQSYGYDRLRKINATGYASGGRVGMVTGGIVPGKTFEETSKKLKSVFDDIIKAISTSTDNFNKLPKLVASISTPGTLINPQSLTYNPNVGIPTHLGGPNGTLINNPLYKSNEDYDKYKRPYDEEQASLRQQQTETGDTLSQLSKDRQTQLSERAARKQRISDFKSFTPTGVGFGYNSEEQNIEQIKKKAEALGLKIKPEKLQEIIESKLEKIDANKIAEKFRERFDLFYSFLVNPALESFVGRETKGAAQITSGVQTGFTTFSALNSGLTSAKETGVFDEGGTLAGASGLATGVGGLATTAILGTVTGIVAGIQEGYRFDLQHNNNELTKATNNFIKNFDSISQSGKSLDEALANLARRAGGSVKSARDVQENAGLAGFENVFGDENGGQHGIARIVVGNASFGVTELIGAVGDQLSYGSPTKLNDTQQVEANRFRKTVAGKRDVFSGAANFLRPIAGVIDVASNAYRYSTGQLNEKDDRGNTKNVFSYNDYLNKNDQRLDDLNAGELADISRGNANDILSSNVKILTSEIAKRKVDVSNMEELDKFLSDPNTIRAAASIEKATSNSDSRVNYIQEAEDNYGEARKGGNAEKIAQALIQLRAIALQPAIVERLKVAKAATPYINIDTTELDLDLAKFASQLARTTDIYEKHTHELDAVFNNIEAVLSGGAIKAFTLTDNPYKNLAGLNKKDFDIYTSEDHISRIDTTGGTLQPIAKSIVDITSIIEQLKKTKTPEETDKVLNSVKSLKTSGKKTISEDKVDAVLTDLINSPKDFSGKRDEKGLKILAYDKLSKLLEEFAKPLVHAQELDNKITNRKQDNANRLIGPSQRLNELDIDERNRQLEFKNSFREFKGETIRPEEHLASLDKEFKTLGGLDTGEKTVNKILELQQRLVIDTRAVATATDAGDRAIIAGDIAKNSVELTNTQKAMELLSKDTRVLAAINKEQVEIQKQREGGQNLLSKLSGLGPEEKLQYNLKIGYAQKYLSGAPVSGAEQKGAVEVIGDVTHELNDKQKGALNTRIAQLNAKNLKLDGTVTPDLAKSLAPALTDETDREIELGKIYTDFGTALSLSVQATKQLTEALYNLTKDAIKADETPALATGGFVGGTFTGGDSVRAKLTPGEFVVKRTVAQQHGDFLTALNNGYASGGEVDPERLKYARERAAERAAIRAEERDSKTSRIYSPTVIRRKLTAKEVKEKDEKDSILARVVEKAIARRGKGGNGDTGSAIVLRAFEKKEEERDEIIRRSEDRGYAHDLDINERYEKLTTGKTSVSDKTRDENRKGIERGIAIRKGINSDKQAAILARVKENGIARGGRGGKGSNVENPFIAKEKIRVEEGRKTNRASIRTNTARNEKEARLQREREDRARPTPEGEERVRLEREKAAVEASEPAAARPTVTIPSEIKPHISPEYKPVDIDKERNKYISDAATIKEFYELDDASDYQNRLKLEREDLDRKPEEIQRKKDSTFDKAVNASRLKRYNEQNEEVIRKTKEIVSRSRNYFIPIGVQALFGEEIPESIPLPEVYTSGPSKETQRKVAEGKQLKLEQSTAFTMQEAKRHDYAHLADEQAEDAKRQDKKSLETLLKNLASPIAPFDNARNTEMLRTDLERRQDEEESKKKFKVRGFATGGQVDSVPAMLTPGEFVVKKDVAQKNLPLLHNLNSTGTVKFANGGSVGGGGGVSSSMGDIGKFAEGMRQFIDSSNKFAQAIDKLASIKLPEKIELSATHNVTVTMNGGQVLQDLLNGPLGEIVKRETENAIKQYINPQTGETKSGFTNG